jgi:hypothetical protein
LFSSLIIIPLLLGLLLLLLFELLVGNELMFLYINNNGLSKFNWYFASVVDIDLWSGHCAFGVTLSKIGESFVRLFPVFVTSTITSKTYSIKFPFVLLITNNELADFRRSERKVEIFISFFTQFYFTFWKIPRLFWTQITAWICKCWNNT